MLEARVAQLEEECRKVQEELESLCNAYSVLEVEVATERSVSSTAAQVSWEALKHMDGAMS